MLAMIVVVEELLCLRGEGGSNGNAFLIFMSLTSKIFPDIEKLANRSSDTGWKFYWSSVHPAAFPLALCLGFFSFFTRDMTGCSSSLRG